ncbi:hypothetical protein [Dietzia sp. ANT_WB102]|uniref:hypothetical protein n=1 Tax=Dietzia sp. ANT_WB102 TaxID=2597345 RepID=UPI0011EBCB35|nr:hypothetical protein [Dietzia sp. ANT_WB102]KAA0919268.1 hypothetical protein FQ137_08415 [Dietzia sp. ANT_WB102]
MNDSATLTVDGGQPVASRRKVDLMISNILKQLGTGSSLYESGSAAADSAYDIMSNLLLGAANLIAGLGS